MENKTQALLKEILDLLEPGLSLNVIHPILITAFGREDTARKAERFANANKCAFRYEPSEHYGDGFGVFGRAYSKSVDDKI